MTADDLLASASPAAQGQAPDDLSPLVRALWLEARGDWEAAHQLAQDDDSRDAAWVHAYLHRKEGDDGNASYWYGRAGRPVEHGSFGDEWRAIASALLRGPGR